MQAPHTSRCACRSLFCLHARTDCAPRRGDGSAEEAVPLGTAFLTAACSCKLSPEAQGKWRGKVWTAPERKPTEKKDSNKICSIFPVWFD